MKVHEFKSEIWLPAAIGKVFEFFSDAGNLDAITPAWVHFNVVTQSPVPMHAGALIDYKLRIRGIPVRWRTRINVWDPPHRFVDEQIRGPYRQWIHEHTFQPHNGGTLVRDKVNYAVPFDWLVHRWFVEPDVQRIFEFRAMMLKRQFGAS
jgi:ligand-binding SRPBCC domain-containing protein